jgi:hypothetical protein
MDGMPNLSAVMPGLVPGIHVFLCRGEDVDGRDKPGHDQGEEGGVSYALSA